MTTPSRRSAAGLGSNAVLQFPVDDIEVFHASGVGIGHPALDRSIKRCQAPQGIPAVALIRQKQEFWYPYFLVYRPWLAMLSKLTSKNQLTLPKTVISQFPGVDYFEVSAEQGRIVLKPLRKSRIEEVWEKMEKLGITENDVVDAVKWSRRKPQSKPGA